MKRVISFIVAGIVLVAQAGGAWAVTLTKTCAVSAVLPSATTLATTAAQFNWIDDPNSTNPNAFVPDASTWTQFADAATFALAFGNLTNNGSGSWSTVKGFAVDVANNGNTGAPQVQFTYTEGTNPNGTGHGLGYKVSLGFNKLVYNAADPLNPTHTLIYRKALRDSNVTITTAQILGGWLRVYMGIYVPPANDDPNYVVTNAEPFTSSDTPGTYTGTLVVTSTHA